VRNSFLRFFCAYLFLLPAIAFGQYYSITCDSQNPSEQFVLDKVFSGNTPMLRSYHYDDGVAIDLTPWAMEFYYSYGQYDTNGGVTIVGSVSSNCATYLGATNVFFQAYDRYYFSIKGTHSSGYTKTFATGRMIQDYDPGTDTNLITMMGQINMNWFSNNVGAQVESNRVRIAVFETSKVERVRLTEPMSSLKRVLRPTKRLMWPRHFPMPFTKSGLHRTRRFGPRPSRRQTQQSWRRLRLFRLIW